jgi:hypothetical protein
MSALTPGAMKFCLHQHRIHQGFIFTECGHCQLMEAQAVNFQ